LSTQKKRNTQNHYKAAGRTRTNGPKQESRDNQKTNFKTMKKLLFIFLTSLALVGCSQEDANLEYVFHTDFTYLGDSGIPTGSYISCPSIGKGCSKQRKNELELIQGLEYILPSFRTALA
jgi:hypothetical protein